MRLAAALILRIGLGLLLIGPARADSGPGWVAALKRLNHPSGRERSEAVAWLTEHLAAAEVAPFLEALAAERGEARLRGVRVLAARTDLFAALALFALEVRPGPVQEVTREALLGQVAMARRPGPDRPATFQPLPALVVRFGQRARTPAEVVGLLTRVCEFPLPLIAWPGLVREAWAPPRDWGGDLRLLLGPRTHGLPWTQGQRLHLGQDLIVLAPEEDDLPGELGPCLWRLLLALSGESTRAEAAVALGLLPYGPIGPFLLVASGPEGPAWPEFLPGLAAFTRSLGFSGRDARQAWTLLLEALPGAEGERLAWVAVGLASLGPGSDEVRGRELWQKLAALHRRDAWKVLLPAQICPFPGLAQPLQDLLLAGPVSPREAALALRGASLLGLDLPWSTVSRAAALAGPGVSVWAARLVAPLTGPELEAAREALNGSAREAALAAAALGLTPGVGPRVLMEALEGGGPPDRLTAVLAGLRLAGDEGDGEVASSLLSRWEGASPRARLPLAIGIGLLLDGGKAWESAHGDPAAGRTLFRTWQTLDRIQPILAELLRLLLDGVGDAGQALGPLAGRAAGRLLGLFQSATLLPFLDLVREPGTREQALLLLRELSFHSQVVANFLASRATSGLGPFRGIPPEILEELAAIGALLRPSTEVGLGLDSVDPWSWALTFWHEIAPGPAGAGRLPGPEPSSPASDSVEK